MRQTLITMSNELHELRERLLKLSERDDVADHFLDHSYARSALRAQAKDADRLAQSIKQLANYRRPPPASLGAPKPPRLPASLQERPA